MPIQIFDVDGTLTYAFGDIENTTPYSSYAFWNLLSEHFAQDPQVLLAEIQAWNKSMATEPDPTGSSARMMQRSLDLLQPNIDATQIKTHAQRITEEFIQGGIVRKDALAYLNRCAEHDIQCVLSTGSYVDGLAGFVDTLVAHEYLSLKARANLLLSGASVDWKTHQLLHANIRERKQLGLCLALQQTLPEIKAQVTASFGDDPYVNDVGILDLAPPQHAFVIKTNKNQTQPFNPAYRLVTWEQVREIYSKDFFTCE